MLTDSRSPLLRYAIAVASVALALSLASLLARRADPSHFTLFFAAVMMSAWYGGLGAGLLATILSALVAGLFLYSPNLFPNSQLAGLFAFGRILYWSHPCNQLISLPRDGGPRRRCVKHMRSWKKRVEERTAELTRSQCIVAGRDRRAQASRKRTLGHPARDGASGTACRPGPDDRYHRP